MSNEIERIEQAYRDRDASGVTAIYSYENPAFLFHMQERERVLLAALKDFEFSLSGKSVLEVGCGTGHILQRLVEFGAARASGVELMPNRVTSARQSYPTLDIQQGNAAALNYPDHSFDLVTQFMCISSVLDPALRQAIAREMWRTLKPGGLFLSYDLRPNTSIFGHIRSALGKAKRLFHAPTVSSGHITPIKPLGMDEIIAWRLNGELKKHKISLSFRLAETARYSRFLAEMLALAPWLRTSMLVIIKKPAD